MKNFYLAIFAVALLLSSCGNSEFPGFTKEENGVYSKFHKSNPDAQKAQVGDFLTMSMTYGLKDSIIVDNRANKNPIQLIEPQFKGDIFDALSLLHKGDSATFIVSADSFFLRTSGLRKLPDFVDSGSMLYFNLRLDNVQTAEELQAAEMKRIAELQEKEIADLQKYLEENNITEEPLANGMYFINKRNGKGRQAKAGDKVSVHYTGRFLDGKKFDSSRDRNKPIEFTLGQGMVIKGWDEGIARMNKGEMATLIIPSAIAYGPQGRPGIPPYSTLVFDVELVDIK